MATQDNYITTNQTLWNQKTQHHVGSDFYKMDDFLSGKSSLNEIELQLLGDVQGKTILHLQCHFGQDSLSLARMGAHVTGVDLSGDAIKKATELNETLGLNANFICADVYSLPDILQKKYDIVFTSYGTIVWLPDTDKWAQVIARHIAPEGKFVFADFHPLAMMHDDDFTTTTYGYFNTGVIEETEDGTYADRNADIHLSSMTWNHSLSETFQSLINAGLSITTFREYNYSPYPCFGNMTEVAPGKFQANMMGDKAPLVYAIIATPTTILQQAI